MVMFDFMVTLIIGFSFTSCDNSQWDGYKIPEITIYFAQYSLKFEFSKYSKTTCTTVKKKFDLITFQFSCCIQVKKKNECKKLHVFTFYSDREGQAWLTTAADNLNKPISIHRCIIHLYRCKIALYLMYGKRKLVSSSH